MTKDDLIEIFKTSPSKRKSWNKSPRKSKSPTKPKTPIKPKSPIKSKPKTPTKPKTPIKPKSPQKSKPQKKSKNKSPVKSKPQKKRNSRNRSSGEIQSLFSVPTPKKIDTLIQKASRQEDVKDAETILKDVINQSPKRGYLGKCLSSGYILFKRFISNKYLILSLGIGIIVLLCFYYPEKATEIYNYFMSTGEIPYNQIFVDYENDIARMNKLEIFKLKYF